MAWASVDSGSLSRFRFLYCRREVCCVVSVRNLTSHDLGTIIELGETLSLILLASL